MRILSALQETVQYLHDVEVDLDVNSYVIDDDTRRGIPGARASLPEQLFVREDADGMAIALYIDPRIVATLERTNPHAHLHAGNLENYCIALEGVSHFVLVTWRAILGDKVRPLELEIQAEVDKFVASWLLLAAQGLTLQSSAPKLIRQLFTHYALRDELSLEETDRYHLATRVAHRFCLDLASRYGHDERATGAIVRDVRAFSRQSLAEKICAA